VEECKQPLRRPIASPAVPSDISCGNGEPRTIMTLGTPQDVTSQELRIETFFPADEASERVWKRVTSE